MTILHSQAGWTVQSSKHFPTGVADTSSLLERTRIMQGKAGILDKWQSMCFMPKTASLNGRHSLPGQVSILGFLTIILFRIVCEYDVTCVCHLVNVYICIMCVVYDIAHTWHMAVLWYRVCMYCICGVCVHVDEGCV